MCRSQEDVCQSVMSLHVSLSCKHEHRKQYVHLHAARPQNIIELVSLTVDTAKAKGDRKDKWNKLTQGILGKGRLVTQADSQPSSMRMDEHQTSSRCHTLLIPKSLTQKRVPQVFITFPPAPPLGCRIQLHFNMQDILSWRFSALTIASYEQTPF